MSSHYTVLVVGAGPAGSALSLVLARAGLSVLLVEQSDLLGSRVGELLSPEGVTALRHLLPQTADDLLHFHLSVRSAWNSDKLSCEHDNALAPWRAIERPQLDRQLALEAQRHGATLALRNKIRRPQRCGDRWEVGLEHDGCPQTVTANLLVDATGRASTLSKSLGASRIFRTGQIALVGRLACSESTREAPREMLLESSPHGWWYAAPIQPGSAVAVLITDNDLDKGQPDTAWRNAFEATWHVRHRFASYTLQGKPHRVSAESSILVSSYGDGWMAVGDAASCLDPLSSLGVGRALRQGQQVGSYLAETLSRGERPNPRQLAEDNGAEFLRETRALASWYSRVTRWPASSFWQRRDLLAHHQPYKAWRRTYTPPRKVAITWGRGIEWAQYLELEQQLLNAPDVSLALRELRWSLSVWVCLPGTRPLLSTDIARPETFLDWLDELLAGSLLCCLEPNSQESASDLFERLFDDRPVSFPSLGWSGRFSELAASSRGESLRWLGEEVSRYQRSLIEGKFLVTRTPLLQNLCLLSVLPLFLLITTLLVTCQQGGEGTERDGYERALELAKETTRSPLDQLACSISSFHLDKALEFLQAAQSLLPFTAH